MIQCWEMSFGVEEMGSSKWHAGQITYRMHNLHTYVLVRHTSSSTSLHTKKQTKQKKHEALCQIFISHSKQWDLCHPPAALMPAPQTTTSADSPADDISPGVQTTAWCHWGTYDSWINSHWLLVVHSPPKKTFFFFAGPTFGSCEGVGLIPMMLGCTPEIAGDHPSSKDWPTNPD